ncbi:biotin-dependent carboxyltransferase family protein [Halalkalibacter krulwichiae]|uniref:KipI antagonist n=1 Tax=Halalkalibacter krulwichiae TaxID=199441 RepID=A0A1X9M7K5_9BACI|nr:biotin-dependent carboxyltransferase family protein [Halalkalibacter krulwichiae]ARK28590.1 KipI antagonist [Halalkalibacter krulwichiae]
MTLTILKPGLLTTIQDLGRAGYLQQGIIMSGAMDTISLRLANLLVGNAEGEGALEITLAGPEIFFEENTLIAITGADLSPTINRQSIPLSKPIYVQKGSILSFGPAKQGCRSYLAVGGGFKIPKVLNSVSTYLRAKIGGYNGRALQAGDVLSVSAQSKRPVYIKKNLTIEKGTHFKTTSWIVSPDITANLQEKVVRLLPGPHLKLFKEESIAVLQQQSFQITAQSDRMGYRLKGPPLQLRTPVDLLSEAVTFGTIQVPADGQPIILLADRQTIGGYPRIGQVVSVDLPIVAQAKPGETLSFKMISFEEAERLFVEREKQLAQLKAAIRLKSLYQ